MSSKLNASSYLADNNHLVENQDLLLSSGALSASDLVYDSFSILNGATQNGSNIESVRTSEQRQIDFISSLIDDSTNINNNLSNTLIQRPARQLSQSKDEILDLNIFDMLQADDPDMANLLESVNNGDLISYLPQISVNSTTKVLENASNEPIVCSNSGNQNILIKLDELIENTSSNANPDAFKEFCDLLALNKEDFILEDTKVNLSKEKLNSLSPTSLTPPLTPKNILQPSRVSQRLKSKQINSANKTSEEEEEMNYKRPRRQTSIASAQRTSVKRKRSLIDKDQGVVEIKTEKSNTLLLNSNDNSFDSDPTFLNEEQGIYDDESFECTKDSMDFNRTISTYDDNDNSNDRDFKNYVKRVRMMHNKERRGSDLSNYSETNGLGENPIKKESNKEAATRYRLKKLNEKDQLFETRIHLEKENDQVKKKIELVQTEINYLKMLLIQMLITKGVRQNDLLKECI